MGASAEAGKPAIHLIHSIPIRRHETLYAKRFLFTRNH